MHVNTHLFILYIVVTQGTFWCYKTFESCSWYWTCKLCRV